MKKLLILSIVLLFSANAIAQDKDSDFTKGKSALSGFVNTMTNANAVFRTTTGIMYSHYFRDGLASRTQVRVGHTKNRISKEDKDYDTYSEVLLGLGLQKSLISGKRFDGYAGVDGLAGTNSVKETYSDNNYYKKTVTEYGLRPFMGIQVFYDSHFFVGLEWGYDVLFNNAKDKRVNGPTTTDNKLSRNTIVEVTDLSAFSLRIGFNF